MTLRIRFLGATGTVTGSRYLLETDASRVLVDCGLFQGPRALRERNWTDPPFDPTSLDAVVLTHAHIDHTGYLPRLCQIGFGGPIHCTSGTRDLLEILLPDSGYLQEEAARHANTWGYSKHHPARPLYTRDDAMRALEQLVGHPWYEPVHVAPEVSARFTRAGHILGSACVALDLGGSTVTFTGDIGRPVDPIMKPPDPLGATDYLLTESTYGDRLHPGGDIHDDVAEVVRDTAGRGGVVLVPAFAVGRAQHLMHILADLTSRGRIPEVPVFLDSPMAISATRIFCANTADHRLSDQECEAMCEVAQYTRTPAESKAIDERVGPMIVISASGMATGGRILHHLKRFLPDEKSSVLLVGYQSMGTRGRSLADGARTVRIHGQDVPVRARVVQLHGLSAHADWREMQSWLATASLAPRQVFVTHGEADAATAFRQRLAEAFGWNTVVPEDGSSWTLAP